MAGKQDGRRYPGGATVKVSHPNPSPHDKASEEEDELPPKWQKISKSITNYFN